MSEVAALNKFIEKTGGPAFPSERQTSEGATLYMPGMSLRDWFAGQALVGMGTWSPFDPQDKEQKARWAYVMADAMLKAREVQS